MALLVPSRIDCLILDLFGVIVSFDDRLVYDRIAQFCADPHNAHERMLDLVSEPNLICGRVSLQDLYERLVAEVGLRASPQQFESMWIASYSEPMPGMRDLLRQLSSQCRLVLLSNVDPYYWPTIHSSLPEFQLFHAKALSFECGIAKPDTRSFQNAVTLGQAQVEHCYFVDDKRENIEAAANLGLAGHLFQSTCGLKAALRQAGLRVA